MDYNNYDEVRIISFNQLFECLRLGYIVFYDPKEEDTDKVEMNKVLGDGFNKDKIIDVLLRDFITIYPNSYLSSIYRDALSEDINHLSAMDRNLFDSIFTFMNIHYLVSKPTPLCLNDMKKCVAKAEDVKEDKPVTIYYFIGRSGAGKDYCANKIAELVNNPKYKKIVPVTTRPIRDGEKDGVDYIFYPDKQTLIEKSHPLETRDFEVANGEVWTYGTSLKDVVPGAVYYGIGTIESAVNIMVYLKGTGTDNIFLKIIDVFCDDSICLSSLLNRGSESVDEIIRRYNADKELIESNTRYYTELVMLNNNFVNVPIYNDRGECAKRDIAHIAYTITEDLKNL